ncbi:hypothetical protein D3C72_148650 [compost metagenome]
MQRLPVNTREVILALFAGQVVKRIRKPLTLLVIGGNLGLGLALLYRLASLKKKEPGFTRLRTVILREPKSSPRTPSGSATPSSR